MYHSPKSRSTRTKASNQGQLQEWTEHFTLIFENLKPVEISKNGYSYSKTKMGVAGVIFVPHPPNFEKLYNF